MARVAVQLTNFTGGELSPRLDGRNDLAKYASGCKTLQNMVVYPHGSAARRPGTTFVAEVKTSSAFNKVIVLLELTFINLSVTLFVKVNKDIPLVVPPKVILPLAVLATKQGVVSHRYLSPNESRWVMNNKKVGN